MSFKTHSIQAQHTPWPRAARRASGVAVAVALVHLAGCGQASSLLGNVGMGSSLSLPAPDAALVPTVNIAPAVGWPSGVKPVAMGGLAVTALASNLDHPRWIHVLPNGDVLVAESNSPAKPDADPGISGAIAKLVMRRAGAGVASANRITLLRDVNGDGVADVRTTFLEGLNSPFGMELVGDYLYVANSDAVLRFAYQAGQTRISAKPEKVVDLPAGRINHHWTKNLIASPDGSKLYVTVGSNSNVGERGAAAEEGRAAIWEVDLKNCKPPCSQRLFATGLRNPNGMGWEPESKALWTVVNERDGLGNDLVPDYLTSVKDGAFYGWPYSYFGAYVDVRVTPPRPDLVAKSVVPDYALGSHVAPLGMVFAKAPALLPLLANGAFIGEHGSWNRKPHSGYKVVFVPFAKGMPAGLPVDVLTGFLSPEGKAYGRPVGVALGRNGDLLVADDVGNVVWQVHQRKP